MLANCLQRGARAAMRKFNPELCHPKAREGSLKLLQQHARGPAFLLGISLGLLLGSLFGFLCLDIGKSAGVTRMALMPKLQLVVLGIFFCFVLFVAISKHPPTISSCLAASNLCLASRRPFLAKSWEQDSL